MSWLHLDEFDARDVVKACAKHECAVACNELHVVERERENASKARRTGPCVGHGAVVRVTRWDVHLFGSEGTGRLLRHGMRYKAEWTAVRSCTGMARGACSSCRV